MSILETPRRGRPKKDAVMDTLAVRMPDDLVERLDDYIERFQKAFPGLNITRADAIRQLLNTGLEVENERLKHDR